MTNEMVHFTPLFMRNQFTASDIEACFPWIKAWTTNHRVKKGALPIAKPSTGSGTSNLFSLSELIHAAVVDEESSLGIFGVQHRTSIMYRDPYLDDLGKKRIGTPTGEATDPYYFRPDFYPRHEYRVIVEVEIRHNFLPGRNIPKKDRTGPDTFYHVIYTPERDPDGEWYIDKRLLKWWPRNERLKKIREDTGESGNVSLAFIQVRPLYDIALEVLTGLYKEVG